MTVDTLVLDKVKLIGDQLWIYNKNKKKTSFGDLSTNDKDLVMFTVINLNLTLRSEVNGVEMNIVLKRKATMELMTTYLPTLLLLLLTFSGTFFKVELFGDAMAHNLTIMLVMTTIFTSKIEELPPTSDLKMVDIWLIFCQLVPFTEMVFLTAIDYFKEGVRKQKEREKAPGNDAKQNMILECCSAQLTAIMQRFTKSVMKPNSVAAEQEGNVSKVGELTAVTVQPLETQVIIPHPPLQEEQEEGETEGKEEKEGKKGMDEEEGKGWRERVLEGLEVTGDPLVPTPLRVLHPPHPRPRPHRHLHLLCRILLQQQRCLELDDSC